MEKALIDKIIDYLDYLRNGLQLQVSFCNVLGEFDEYIHLLQPYNSHQNGYCRYIKTSKDAYNRCVQNQKKLLTSYGTNAFYGCCYAGVEEYVFPIHANEKAVGFISVSGYRGKLSQAPKKMQKAQKRYRFSPDLSAKHYNEELTVNVPAMEQISTVIFPVCAMFELLYLQSPKSDSTSVSNFSLYAQIVNYLCYHYQEKITLEILSHQFNYSTSYIRQLFRQKTGQPIAEYLNNLRIKRAKELLQSTSMRVIEISETLGFCNSNYFSNVFKRITGVKPLEYRKKVSSSHENSVLRQFNSSI